MRLRNQLYCQTNSKVPGQHSMNQIYLFGHQKPDTDSIASVIGYAEFMNRSEPGRYVRPGAAS